jgi:hypothetical protein
VPLLYPAKSKIGTSYQIEFYQAMNMMARPENIE